MKCKILEKEMMAGELCGNYVCEQVATIGWFCVDPQALSPNTHSCSPHLHTQRQIETAANVA